MAYDLAQERQRRKSSAAKKFKASIKKVVTVKRLSTLKSPNIEIIAEGKADKEESVEDVEKLPTTID